MMLFFQKYYDKKTRKLLQSKYSCSQGSLATYKRGYSIPKPKKLLTICKAVAETHDIDLDVVLFEALQLIENDMADYI